MVDLNCDLGESYGAFAGGPDEALAAWITSANIACGAYAGDPSSMRRTCALAVMHGAAIGAQVGYPDLLGFGRRFIDIAPDELVDSVVHQIGSLAVFARVTGGRVAYVKPHGALYHAVIHHEAQARAVVRAVEEYGDGLVLLGAPDSELGRVAAACGIEFVGEGFADRRYGADGRLVPRSRPDALLTEPDEAVAQALRLAHDGVRSICVHSDTPGAVDIARRVRAGLAAAGHVLAPFTPTR